MKSIDIKFSFWKRVGILFGNPIRLNFKQEITSYGKDGNDFNIILNDASYTLDANVSQEVIK